MGLKHKKKRLLDIYGIGKGGSVNLKNLTPEEQMEIRKELGLYYSDIEEKKGNRLYIDMNNLVEIPIGSGGDSPVYNSINPDLKGEPTREGNNDVQIGMFSYIPFTLPETMVHYSNEDGDGDDYLAMSVNSPKTREVEEDAYVDSVYPYFDWIVGENTYGADYLRTDSKDKPLEPSSYSSSHYFFYVHTEGDYDFAGGSSSARGETSETAVHLKPGFYLSLYMNGEPQVCGMIKLSDNDNYYDTENDESSNKTSHEYFGDIFPTQSNVVTWEYVQSVLPPLDEIEVDPKVYQLANDFVLYQLYSGKLQGITLPQDEDDDNQDDAKAPSPTPIGNIPFTGSFYYKGDPYNLLTNLSIISKDDYINGLYRLDYNWVLVYIPEDIDLSQNNEPDIQESLSSTRSKKSDLSKFIKNVKSIGDTVIPAGLYVDLISIYDLNNNLNPLYDEFAISIQTTSKIVNATEEVVKGQIDCKYIPEDCKGGGSSETVDITLYHNYDEGYFSYTAKYNDNYIDQSDLFDLLQEKNANITIEYLDVADKNNYHFTVNPINNSNDVIAINLKSTYKSDDMIIYTAVGYIKTSSLIDSNTVVCTLRIIPENSSVVYMACNCFGQYLLA